MGKTGKRFNKKGRQQQLAANRQSFKNRQKLEKETFDTNSKQPEGLQQINGIEIGQNKVDEYGLNNVDDSNKLVILGNKKKSEKKMVDTISQRSKKGTFVSKKQKKKIQRLVEQNKKKAKRGELFQALAEHEVTIEEMAMYKSTSMIGQANNKRKHTVDSSRELDDNVTTSISKGKKKGKRQRLMEKLATAKQQIDEEQDNQMEASSSSEDDESNMDESSAVDMKSNMAESSAVDIKSNAGSIEDVQEEVKLEEDASQPSNGTKTCTVILDNICDTTKMKTSQVIPSSKPAIYINVNRSSKIQAARVLLPILAEEQEVMETIHENDVIIICGETGSGKTTQVPQFLYEAGYGTHSSHSGIIGVTQPRRVAAVSMSKRVAEEMNLNTRKVSFQIRYERNTTDETVIKFMTDGVLLKEMETDFLLSKYCVIIIDEAHERSVFTDILMGLLSRVVPLRKKKNKPLKLIIMSATLRIEDFVDNKRLFPDPFPILKIDSRQYPVTTHFNRRTPPDYVTAAFNKVSKVNRTLKPGGILVFLTGQNEVLALCRKLRKTFPVRFQQTNINSRNEKRNDNSKDEVQDDVEPEVSAGFSLDRYSARPGEDPYVEIEEDEDEDIAFNDNISEEDMDDRAYTPAADADIPLHVLPLFSLLSSEKQAKVFEAPPDGCRLCVVATNVAETSLTIPGIKYVVDCGKIKRRYYDKVTGVSSFRITWTSKASANQRAGRAGRVEPGHCYRLYSSAVFQHEFEEFSEAEIMRRPVDDLLLQMKSMGIIKVLNFPFPTPPDSQALRAGENLLLDLDALKRKKTKRGNITTVITPLGRSMGQIPVAPRYAKMILLAHQENCMQYIITIVAALTVKEIFSDDIKISNDNSDGNKDEAKRKKAIITKARRKWAGEGETALLGDLMLILRAVGACEYAGCSQKFCQDNGLRYKAMMEIRKLRTQLTNTANTLNPNVEAFVDPKMKPPSQEQAKVIRQIILTSLGDRVARKLSGSEVKDSKMKNAYQCCSTDDPVYIHPSSSLFNKLPDYVVYQEIIETSKMYMRGVSAIDQEWLPVFTPYKCTFSKPLEFPSPQFDNKSGKVKCRMTSSYGPHGWLLPAQVLDYPKSIERSRWFGRFFLEGKVCPLLEPHASFLLTQASVMVKHWAHLQPRTETLLTSLTNENVSDRNTLLKIWKRNPTYLLQSYLQWLPESKHETIRKLWPPVR